MSGGGLGGLLTTEVVTSDLGAHGGVRLRGRVQRQAVRVALGSWLRVSAVRVRPLAVEVLAVEGSAGMRLIPIATPPDPVVQLVQRVVMLWVASMVLRRVAGMLRGRRATRREGKAA